MDINLTNIAFNAITQKLTGVLKDLPFDKEKIEKAIKDNFPLSENTIDMVDNDKVDIALELEDVGFIYTVQKIEDIDFSCYSTGFPLNKLYLSNCADVLTVSGSGMVDFYYSKEDDFYWIEDTERI